MLYWPSLLFHFLLYVGYLGQLFLIFVNLLIKISSVCVVGGGGVYGANLKCFIPMFGLSSTCGDRTKSISTYISCNYLEWHQNDKICKQWVFKTIKRLFPAIRAFWIYLFLRWRVRTQDLLYFSTFFVSSKSIIVVS